jgi:hypothetical protein
MSSKFVDSFQTISPFLQSLNQDSTPSTRNSSSNQTFGPNSKLSLDSREQTLAAQSKAAMNAASAFFPALLYATVAESNVNGLSKPAANRASMRRHGHCTGCNYLSWRRARNTCLQRHNESRLSGASRQRSADAHIRPWSCLTRTPACSPRLPPDSQSMMSARRSVRPRQRVQQVQFVPSWQARAKLQTSAAVRRNDRWAAAPGAWRIRNAKRPSATAS